MTGPAGGFRVDWETTAVLELRDTTGALVRVPVVGVPRVEVDWSGTRRRGYYVADVALRPTALELSNPGGQPLRVELAGTVLKADGYDAVHRDTHREREPDGYTEDGRAYWF